MNSPFTGGKTRLEKEWQTMPFRKDSFRICYHYYVCEDTGEQFTNDELDTLNQNQVYNQYRAKYGIPFIDEIQRIREQYELSATKMSEVLGLGANVYRQYEGGEMPSVSSGRLIKLASDANQFAELLACSKNLFETKEYDKVQKKVEHAKRFQTWESILKNRWLFNSPAPDIYNGYILPSIEKVGAMIHHFACAAQPFTTAMNKLMFYADFRHFKQYGRSISGLTYRAIQMGPVPAYYGRIYSEAVEHGFVSIREVEFNEHVGDQFYDKDNTGSKEQPTIFISSEWGVINEVTTWFIRDLKKSTKRIVDASHDEKAWQENVDEFGRISYVLSFDLKHE